MKDFKQYNNMAGIYKWLNKINGKCYIGLSINLGSRLRHHVNNYKHRRYNNPLYKAFDKYGIDNFSVEILYSINNPEPCVKKLLDLLEISYIEKYNAYGKTGYNQTRGGDGGILGYKFTEKQREKVSKNSIESSKKVSKQIVLYNINTDLIFIYSSISSAAREINADHSQISRLCSWNQFLLNDQLVGAYNIEDVYNRAKYVKNRMTYYNKHIVNTGQHHKYSIEIYENSNCIATFNNTTEANNSFFHFKSKRVVLNTVIRTIKNNAKYKGRYTFKLIDSNK